MAKKAKRKAASKGRSRARKLSVRKESVRARATGGTRSTRAIVIGTKALRGMVIDRSVASSLLKPGR